MNKANYENNIQNNFNESNDVRYLESLRNINITRKIINFYHRKIWKKHMSMKIQN